MEGEAEAAAVPAPAEMAVAVALGIIQEMCTIRAAEAAVAGAAEEMADEGKDIWGHTPGAQKAAMAEAVEDTEEQAEPGVLLVGQEHPELPVKLDKLAKMA
jgi:hypothetical protein